MRLCRRISYTAQQSVVCQGLLIIEASRSHWLRHTTFGRIPLDEWSARRRVLYLTTHDNHKRLTSMSQAGIEPANPVNERPQTHGWDRAGTGIGLHRYSNKCIHCITYPNENKKLRAFKMEVNYQHAEDLIQNVFKCNF